MLCDCMVGVWVVYNCDLGVWVMCECGSECHVVEWCVCALIMSFQWESECARVLGG